MRPLPEASSARGAAMGRADTTSDRDYPVQFEAERLQWVDGDYDQGGAYWGQNRGEYIFRFEGESGDGLESMFVRARDIEEAKKQVLDRYANASFSPGAELEAFTAAYAEAALFSTANDLHNDDPQEPEYLNDAGYPVSEATMDFFRRDCERFMTEKADALATALETPGYTVEQAGHDFWLDRNGHGAGFGDRRLGDVGEELADYSRAMSSVDLFVMDGEVHAEGEDLAPVESAEAPRPS